MRQIDSGKSGTAGFRPTCQNACGVSPIFRHVSFNTQQFWSSHSKNGLFNPESGLRIQISGLGSLLGGLCRNACGFIGSKHKIALAKGNNDKACCEDTQYESVESDRIFPGPFPNNRQPLPEGFGWLMLIGTVGGGSVGLAYVLLWIWLANRPDKTSADCEPHDRRNSGQTSQRRNKVIPRVKSPPMLRCPVPRRQGRPERT